MDIFSARDGGEPPPEDVGWAGDGVSLRQSVNEDRSPKVAEGSGERGEAAAVAPPPDVGGNTPKLAVKKQEKDLTQGQRLGKALLKHQYFEHTMAILILFNFVVVIVETDKGASDEDTPQWAANLSWVLLIAFVLELALKFFTYRGDFCHDRWNIFDAIVISTDFIVSILALIFGDLFSISGLRVLRLARLLRATQLAEVFPELRLMLAGLIGAMNAIFWGSIFLVSVLLIWSVIAVQFIHPLNLEVSKLTEEYDSCPRCSDAYASTFQAFLTFCCQIVAGDSWGRETLPVIELYPAAGLFFAAVFMSVGMALLNLILGVVVNVATEERERIAKEMAEEKKLSKMEAHDKLYDLCIEMDEDGSGELSLAEVKNGFDNNPSFRATMEAMDIGREDLDFVFTILDSDKSGTVTAKEFTSQIYRMKSSETEFLIAYIRFYLTEIKHDLKAGQNQLKDDLKQGQVDLSTKLRHGQEELLGKLRTGQDDLQRKLRHGQEDLTTKLRHGQTELQKKLRAGQERLMQDMHKGLNLGKYEPMVDEEPEIKDEEPLHQLSQEPKRQTVDQSPRGETLDSIGSLQWIDERGMLVAPSEDTNESQFYGVAPEHFADPEAYADRLVRLHEIWQQCVHSIDDVRDRHTQLKDRQADLSGLLQRQAKCLVSVIQCAPRTSATELQI